MAVPKPTEPNMPMATDQMLVPSFWSLYHQRHLRNYRFFNPLPSSDPAETLGLIEKTANYMRYHYGDGGLNSAEWQDFVEQEFIEQDSVFECLQTNAPGGLYPDYWHENPQMEQQLFWAVTQYRIHNYRTSFTNRKKEMMVVVGSIRRYHHGGLSTVQIRNFWAERMRMYDSVFDSIDTNLMQPNPTLTQADKDNNLSEDSIRPVKMSKRRLSPDIPEPSSSQPQRYSIPFLGLTQADEEELIPADLTRPAKQSTRQLTYQSSPATPTPSRASSIPYGADISERLTYVMQNAQAQQLLTPEELIKPSGAHLFSLGPGLVGALCVKRFSVPGERRMKGYRPISSLAPSKPVEGSSSKSETKPYPPRRGRQESSQAPLETPAPSSDTAAPTQQPEADLSSEGDDVDEDMSTGEETDMEDFL
ncbi:MAG: hypothetical protein M1814_002932 [Vezdaea aestivalis]|nr:MAG: hypothetical protein M1814_002932 [Vezdaea aestivalis]